MHRPDKAPLCAIIFLQDISGETEAVFAKIPLHIDEPFPPVVIVKERGIETDRVEVNRIAPWPSIAGAVMRKHVDL
jgi:hypothetical protein